MTSDRWERINALFDSACSLSQHERISYLEQETHGDRALIDDVLRLLEHHENEGFLDKTVPDVQEVIRTAAPVSPLGPLRTFAVGDVVGARFVIQRFLGRGGMGEVYSAFDKELRERVALKTIRADIATDDSIVDKFRGEVQRARRIVHANTCRVYDIFSDERDGRIVRFLTMELLEGDTLEAFLKRHGRLGLAESLELLEQMAAGLNAVHDTGLVHRDFKPANVFLVPRSGGKTRVVVTDFGLARRMASSRSSGETSRTFAAGAGTPAYMAPEQFLGLDITPATDVYALGLIAYEMVTGARPFPADLATRRLVEAAPSPAVHVDDLPPEWNETILACLERDPLARPPLPLDVLRRLRGQPTASGSHTPVPPPPSRRWLRPAIAAAVCLVVAAVVFWPSRQLIHSESENHPALSPDGKWLVFTEGREGARDLILQQLPQGTRRNLTSSNPLDDAEAAFAPDGKQLAFVSERREGQITTRGIFLLDLNSQKTTFLTADGHAPAWSPDGRRLAFVQEGLIEAANRNLHRSKLFVLNLATGQVQELHVEDALQPAWSPNGRWIAFVQIRAGYRTINLLDLESSEVRSLTPGNAVHWTPAWSSDGKHLYYCSDTNGAMNLYRLRVEELTGTAIGEPQSVPVPGDYIGPIATARSAPQLAYVRDLSTTTLYRAPLDLARSELGAAEKLPLTSSLMLAVELAISADGAWLAFSTQRTQRDIFVVNVDGSRQRRLTNDSFRDLDPAWSPDGKWIAFQSNRVSNSSIPRYEIHGVRPDGTSRWQMTATATYHPRNAVAPVWSPDGRQLAFTINGVGVFATSPAAGRTDSSPEKLAGFEALDGQTFIAKAWSRDGRTIAGIRLSADGRPSGLSLLDVASREFRSLTSDQGLGPVWLPDSRFLLYRKSGTVYLADSVTRVTKALALPPAKRLYSTLVAAPDGQSIIFNDLQRKTSVYVLNLDSLR